MDSVLIQRGWSVGAMAWGIWSGACRISVAASSFAPAQARVCASTAASPLDPNELSAFSPKGLDSLAQGAFYDVCGIAGLWQDPIMTRFMTTQAPKIRVALVEDDPAVRAG